MRTIDLRHETLTIDELLKMAGGEGVLLRSKEGSDFIVEPAGFFERELEELGRSEAFIKFLDERLQEPGRTPIEDIERRLAQSLPDEESP
jgi:hypothetical protein